MSEYEKYKQTKRDTARVSHRDAQTMLALLFLVPEDERVDEWRVHVDELQKVMEQKSE